MQVIMTDCTKDPVDKIGAAAGRCYGAVGNNARRVVSALKAGHYSILRFAYATFDVSGISLVCSHQMVRIGHAGILQVSLRHVEGAPAVIAPPSIISDNELLEMYDGLHIYSESFYRAARSRGIKKEDARYGLLNGTETGMAITGNFQMWGHFLALRMDIAAQWEIRAVANVIRNELAVIAPEVFGVLV